MPNRLGNSASPYLRSHSENPVEWWPWGDEPFAEAARRDVPVLVSIGYATCHWCHVMARESFSDPVVAAYLSENFVSIKVDREEHVEVDSTYLAAASAFTPQLGWPLTVFVTPHGRAFYAGTYFPPEPVAGRASFRQVLDAVLDAWRNRRDEVERGAASLASALVRPHDAHPVAVDLDAAVAGLAATEDPQFGGLGDTPKFPVAPALRLLADRASTGDEPAQALLDRALDALLPLADRVDGGFFRYATRADFSEPHYERMLYDNAQLLAVYALAGRTETASGIAGFLLDTLQQPAGGFASAQDSESVIAGERVEGGYYLLDAAARKSQIPPALDEKVLTGINGLVIEALAIAGRRLDRPDWIAAAVRAADFLLENHVLGDTLLRASIGEAISPAPPALDDYGMLARGLLELSIATGEPRFAIAARDLVDATIAAGEPFGIPGGSDPVLVAQGLSSDADPADGAHPSGWSALAGAAHVLYLLTAHEPYRRAAAAVVERTSSLAVQRPLAFGAVLSVASALTEPVRQGVVVSNEPRPAPGYRSGGLTIVVTEVQARAFADAGFELLEGRVAQGGRPTAYECEEFVCRLPVTDPEQIARALGG